MEKLNALKKKDLRRCVDVTQLHFKTTDELEPLTEFFGQARAFEAASFGSGIQAKGYNLFAVGISGTGKRAIIQSILEKKAITKPIPADWCYVFNFESPQKPITLQLPSGLGRIFQEDMRVLLVDLKAAIPGIFETEEFRTRMQKINEEISFKQESFFKNITKEAKEKGLLILSTHEGFSVMPLDEKNDVMTQEVFDQLSEKEKKEKQALIVSFTQRLADFIKQVPGLQKKRIDQEKKILKEFTLIAVGQSMNDLKRKYKHYSEILSYLEAVEQDVILNVKDFIKKEESQSVPFISPEMPSFTRYQVNLLVNHEETTSAPIVFEENPTYSNLICRLDHEAHFGALLTDFTLIKPGALHQANGGYLIIDARKLLTQPYAWDGLKRALFDRQIKIEPVENLVGIFRTTSLEPSPIPLDIKVVLTGDSFIFNLLHAWDSDFSKLFKVKVEFQDRVDWSQENLHLYAKFMAAIIQKEKMLPFHRSAVAALIEYSSRISGDAEKLSIRVSNIQDLLHEASYWAKHANKNWVGEKEVEQAVQAQIRRLDRVREDYYEQIQRDIIFIDTQGEIVGQVNGLAVVESGNFSFGYPTRITANVRMGNGEVVDIQREVKLSGPIHSKGVLILSSFLAGRYSRDQTFSLSASIAFEQTYGLIEGDSASVAELCALLSAIAEIPIKQEFAVTGSVNQHGEVQPVGGVNEKIEGFFDICKSRGLSGKQGVLIPAANVHHLMLRKDVVKAVASKKFSVYPIENVDQAIVLLMGTKAGKKTVKGWSPKLCFNAQVEKCLQKFSKKQKQSKK